MPASDPLPPPASGLFLEVSFRRLLLATEAVVAGDEGGDGDGPSSSSSAHPLAARPDLRGGAWRGSPVFHHYVETLQDQLADLEATAGPDRLPPPLAAAYRARADAVAAALSARPAPPACVPDRAAAAAAAAVAAAGADTDGGTPPAPLPPAAGPPPLSTDPAAPLDAATGAARAALLGGGAGAGGRDLSTSRARPDPATLRPAPPPASTAGLGKTAAGAIATQRAIQESLTDDLVGLAAGLRANAEAARGRLDDRGRLVDGADAALDAAVAASRSAAAGAGAALRASRRSFWGACLAFACVGGVFTATFLYIRATSLLGYSARRAAAAAARRAAKAAAAAAAEAGAAGGAGARVEL